MERLFFVYVYKDEHIVPFYVGKGKNNRHLTHMKQALRGVKKSPNLNKIRSIIERGSLPIIEIYRDCLTEQEAFDLEMELIIKYGRVDLKTGTLKNLNAGGGTPSRGYSEATRSKLASNKGKKLSIEHRSKLRDNNIMNSKTVFQIWCDKYGMEKATELKVASDKKRASSTSASLRKKYGKVFKYTLDGELVCVYQDRIEAREHNEFNRSTFTRYLNSGKPYNGYYYQSSENKPGGIHNGRVYVYNLENVLLKYYHSKKEVVEGTGLDMRTFLRYIDTDLHLKGFFYRTSDEPDFQLTPHPLRRPVYVYDADGSLLTSYCTLKEAYEGESLHPATLKKYLTNRKPYGNRCFTNELR